MFIIRPIGVVFVYFKKADDFIITTFTGGISIPTLKRAFENEKLVPYSEILDGKITENSFAAGFHSVITGKADEIYNDPEKYFKLTHFTNNLKNIFSDALVRVSRGGARPLLVVDTTFGGGKTHTLVGLYHLFKHFDVSKENGNIKSILNDIGISEIPEVSLVSIDGHNVSSVKKEEKARTIWGEIGKQLGCYDLIETFDQELRKPDSDTLIQMLNSTGKPVLIMIDELVNHLKDSQAEVVGNTNLAEITVGFFHTLTDVVVSSEKAMFILTLPGTESSYKKESEMLEEYKAKIRDIAGREASFTVPMEKSEIYEVIKKRLFEHVDESYARQVAEKLQQFYASSSENFPEDVLKPAYYEKIIKSYPFHPALIDLLYERISTISDFQKTRGVLRLLSHVMRDVHSNISLLPDELAITPGVVNLNNQAIFQELTSKISRGEFQNVIKTDIVNNEGEAKCQRLDSKADYGSNVRISTSIYLYTLIGTVKETSIGCNLRDLTLSTSMNNVMYPKDISNEISELDKQLWYIYSKVGKWHFSVDPNINKVISDETERVDKVEYDPVIKKGLRKMLDAGSYFDVYTWEHDVRSPSKPTLIAVDYNEIKTAEGEVPKEIQEIIEKEGTTFRTKKNLIFVLVPRRDRTSKMIDSARRYIAIQGLKTIAKTRDELKNYSKKLDELAKESESNLNSAIELCYSLIYYPQKTNVKVITVQNGYQGAKNLPDKVLIALQDKAKKIIETLNPVYIEDKILNSKSEITVQEIYSSFEEAPAHPFPKNRQVINTSITNGVMQKNFALYVGGIGDLTSISESNYMHVSSNFYYGRTLDFEPREAHYLLPKERAESIESKLNDITDQIKKKQQSSGTSGVSGGLPISGSGSGGSFGGGTGGTGIGTGHEGPESYSRPYTLSDVSEIEEYKGYLINHMNFSFSNPRIFSQLESKLSLMLLGISGVKYSANVRSEKLNLSFNDAEISDLNKLMDILSKISDLFSENLSADFKLSFGEDFEINDDVAGDVKGLEPFKNDIVFDFELIKKAE